MTPKSKALKPRIGRPPLAPGERRDRQLNVLMTTEERQVFIAEALKTGRSVSEVLMRRLRATLEHQDIWDDLAELRQARAQTAMRILVGDGWTKRGLGERGEMLLSPLPSEAATVVEVVPNLFVSSDVHRIAHAVFAACGVVPENRELIAQAFFKALKGRIPNTATKQAQKGAA